MKRKISLVTMGIILLSTNIYCQSESKLRYYSANWEDPDLYSCYNKMLISFEQDELHAFKFSFCDATGGNPSFLSGKKDGNFFAGIGISPAFSEEGDFMGTDTTKFDMKFSTDSTILILTTYNYFGPNRTELKKSVANYTVQNGKKKLHEAPLIDSKILIEFDSQKTKVGLLGIGKAESIDQTFGFWYKAEIQGITGWFFGEVELN